LLFNKVLIANRGEIAVRVLRACRELGIPTVAVYSEADRQSLHVRYADEAYFLGPSPARDSYLRADKILEIAKRCGADAVHPGYGFLAEREDFARGCEDAGIVFIGPKPSSIAAKAGIPVVPGTEGEGNLSDEELIRIGPQVGFPLLVKASAGGGGKGMREVKTAEELPHLLKAARREAEAAFGDGNVYLEKLILTARHVEFQILADKEGNVIHLGERECSLQRRHQKLFEEAPSPFIGNDDALRKQMGEVACRTAASVGYHNAGTIEFLVDKDRKFYFLEMNTRLQVEHPATEMITGIDIVKEQIRIARGRPLRYRQDDVKLSGWSLECRINAEDPYSQFAPSTGRLQLVLLPTGPGVRVDTGVYSGFEVTPYYDSLISKLIVWGETRAEAILRMRRALEEYRIIGVKTNIPFHQALLDSPRFMAGLFDTRFVEERFALNGEADGADHYPDMAAIFATLMEHQSSQRAAQIMQPVGRAASRWKWSGRGGGAHR
jgi:acetyl-CoA carboxylase biotin carboxylase subunit